MSRLPVFGWDAGKLSAHSFESLEELRQSIVTDPQNSNPQHASGKSIYLYTPAARRKLNVLSWAITYKLRKADHR